MKIAIVTSDGLDAPGGIARVMSLLVTYSARYGLAADFVAIRTRFGTRSIVRHLLTPVSLTIAMLRLIFGHFDLVHVNVAPRGSTVRKLVLCRVLSIFNISYVLHLHGSGYDAYFLSLGRIGRGMVRAGFARARSVIVLGEYWRSFAAKELGLIDSKVRVIPNGVPDDGLADHGKAETCRIATVGTVGERKGTDVLLRALASVKSPYGWNCQVCGDGEVAEYETLRDRLGLRGRVEFRGHMSPEGVTQVLRNTDIFVLPSRAENQPLAILEAMSNGLPVVATRVGAIPEQVRDGEGGLLVDPGDVEGLAAAIEHLLLHPEARLEMGRFGRRVYEEKFSLEAFVTMIGRLYADAAF